MGGDSSNQNGQRKERTPWSPFRCLFYGGVGVAAGVLGYYAHKWIKESLESQKDESTKKEYEQHETKHHRTAETLKRLETARLIGDGHSDQYKIGKKEIRYKQRKDSIVNLVKKIEFHFYRNQQISDVTALRSLSTIQKYINTTFNVTSLTDLLRDNPSRLTPAEKHHSFDQVKILCFSRLLSALYVLLFRLWLHRIEINILGRQWLPQLVASTVEEVVIPKEDSLILQKELEDCEAFLNGSSTCSAVGGNHSSRSQLDKETTTIECGQQPGSASSGTDLGLTEFHSSMSDSSVSSAAQRDAPSAKLPLPYFKRSRQFQYSARQAAILFPQTEKEVVEGGMNFNSEANYVFLTSTRWLEFQPGVTKWPSLIQPIVEEVLVDIFPQHFIDLAKLRSLFDQMCEKLESKIFYPRETSTCSESEAINEFYSQPTLGVVELLLPEIITSCPSKDSKLTNVEKQQTDQKYALDSVQKSSTPNVFEDEDGLLNHTDELRDLKKEEFHFDTSALTKEEDRHFVQGCLAETRDILESASFHSAFIESRRALLLRCIECLSEKLPTAAQSGESFPLCRIFGRLCGISEVLLTEISEENELYDDNNQFCTLFSELHPVEQLCGAIYLPSIMCPELMEMPNSLKSTI